jgi:hypothetical protein
MKSEKKIEGLTWNYKVSLVETEVEREKKKKKGLSALNRRS